jgi:hypothetical protein
MDNHMINIADDGMTNVENIAGNGDKIKYILDNFDNYKRINEMFSEIDVQNLKNLIDNSGEFLSKCDQIARFVEVEMQIQKVAETGSDKVMPSGKLKESSTIGFTNTKVLNIKEFFMSKMETNPIVGAASGLTFRNWILREKPIHDHIASMQSELDALKRKYTNDGFDDNSVTAKYNKALFVATWKYIKARPNVVATNIHSKIMSSHTKYKDQIAEENQRRKGDQM